MFSEKTSSLGLFPSNLIILVKCFMLTLHVLNMDLFTSLLNEIFLDQYKLKAFADKKSYEIIKLKFDLERVENNVEKGENTGYQLHLLCP